MKKPINTDLDRLNITGQKDPNWLYSGASGKNKDIVNNLEHFNNAIGDYEEIAPLEYGYRELPTGGPTGASVYKPVELTQADYGRMGGDTSIFNLGSGEFWDDLFRNAGKSAEADMLAQGDVVGRKISEENLAQQRLLPTPRSAQESTAGFKPKAGSWLSGAFSSLAGVASKLVAGATSGASNAVTDNTAQQGSAGASSGSSGSNNTGWLIAGGIGLAAMAIIGTIIIVKSKAKK